MTRWIKVLVGAALLTAALWSAATAMAATAQYPDLKTLPPRLLRFDTVDVSGGDTTATGVHDVLRFSNTVWNAGPGKLVLRGALDPATLRGPAYQRIYDDSGNFTEVDTGGIMYFHPSHNHYHFEDWGLFQLWTAANYDAWIAGGRTGGASAQVGSKTTSCVLDEEFIKEVMGSSWPGVFGFSGCNPDANGDLMEGLSSGWGDTYDWWRADQWVDLGPGGKLADGDYVLRSVVDPTNKIYESPGRSDPAREDQSVNDAITRFSVRNGQIIDSDPPTGTVTIANAQPSTTTTKVTVKSLGRDDVSGVDQYRLSNDGTHWKTFTYDGIDSTPSVVDWDLADPTYGGNSNLGTKTVYAQFHDSSGKWGPTQTDTIELQAPPPQTAYSQTILDDGPVGYWRLGETSGTDARDEMAANPGVYVNSPALGSPSLVPSDGGKAVTFDGATNYMKVADSGDLDLGTAITLEAWIKPAALPAAGSFASVLTKPEAYSLQFNGPKLEFTVIQSGTRKRLQAPAGAVVAGQTYHVVGTYDGTTQRLYINGAQVASAPLSGAATTSDQGLFVGSWDGGQEFLKGTIDDAAVYAKTLTAAQVKAHWDKAQPAPTAQPPAAPSNLVANAASPTQVDLTWSDNSSDESSFVLQRSTDSAFSAPVTLNVANDKTSYSDTGLTPVTTYWYRIQSRNPVGVSGWSNVVTVSTPSTTPAPTPPAAPSGTAALPVTSSRIDVSWTDNSSDETSFVVERSTSSAFTTVQSASVAAGATTFSDTGLSPSTTYWYRVKAVNAAGSSAYSAATSATTGAAPTGYAAAVTSDAPVSYWRLGETSGTAAADARGANPGTYRGGPGLGAGSLLATDTTNRATSFDGIDDSMSAPDSNSLDLTSGITLEAWIKPGLLPAAGQFASIVTKPEAYSLQFNGPRLEFTVIQNGVRKRLQAPAGAIVSGQTYHVVGTFDGTTQRLYVNGAQAASSALSGPATVTPSNLSVGSWDSFSEFMTGVIDDVAVYNQPLSASRVAAHYDAGRGTSTPAPPAAPSGLVAGAASSSEIDLSWTDNSADETSFVVERSADSSFSAPQDTTVGSGATSFSDTGRAANTPYWYRVKAVNAAGSSAWSNVATATTKPIASGYAVAVTGDAPVSYWRLGETSGTAAADQRGANPATYRGSPALGAASLVPSDTADHAVSFDGIDDAAAAPDSNSLDLTNGITLEAWIKPSLLPAAGSFASVVTKPEAYSIQFNGGRLEFTVIQNGVRRRLQAPAGAIVAGQTYHVVGTYDGTTQRLYVNGAQAASQALTGAATVTTSGLTIGSWDGFSERFSGVIDDVAIYNRALAASTVSAHYAAAQPPATGTAQTLAAPATVQTTPTSSGAAQLTAARIATGTSTSSPARPHKARAHKAKKHKARARKHHAKHRGHHRRHARRR